MKRETSSKNKPVVVGIHPYLMPFLERDVLPKISKLFGNVILGMPPKKYWLDKTIYVVNVKQYENDFGGEYYFPSKECAYSLAGNLLCSVGWPSDKIKSVFDADYSKKTELFDACYRVESVSHLGGLISEYCFDALYEEPDGVDMVFHFAENQKVYLKTDFDLARPYMVLNSSNRGDNYQSLMKYNETTKSAQIVGMETYTKENLARNFFLVDTDGKVAFCVKRHSMAE